MRPSVALAIALAAVAVIGLVVSRRAARTVSTLAIAAVVAAAVVFIVTQGENATPAAAADAIRSGATQLGDLVATVIGGAIRWIFNVIAEATRS